MSPRNGMQDGEASSEGRTVPRTVLVTGGAGVIGFAAAKALSANRTVVLLDLGDSVQERAAELPDGFGVTCDLADAGDLAVAYKSIFDRIGPPGIVIHCAAIAQVTSFLETDREYFERALAINLTSGFEIFRRSAVELVARGMPGRFISIASISGARAGFGRTAYGTSKAGLIHLTGQMALELGPYGITANTVAPGPVDTPFSRETHTAETRADYQRTIPMARYGTPGEVAHAVSFLASDEAAYVSGQTLFVDGGYMASGMGVHIAQSAAAVRSTPFFRDPV